MTLLACVGEDVPVTPAPPDGGASSSSGSADSGPPPPECQAPAKDCVGVVPRVCNDGHWVAQPPCTQPNPVCNAGVCGPSRLRGGIQTLGVPTGATSKLRLRESGFEASERTCNAGAKLCVSGGMAP